MITRLFIFSASICIFLIYSKVIHALCTTKFAQQLRWPFFGSSIYYLLVSLHIFFSSPASPFPFRKMWDYIWNVSWLLHLVLRLTFHTHTQIYFIKQHTFAIIRHVFRAAFKRITKHNTRQKWKFITQLVCTHFSFRNIVMHSDDSGRIKACNFSFRITTRRHGIYRHFWYHWSKVTDTKKLNFVLRLAAASANVIPILTNDGNVQQILWLYQLLPHKIEVFLFGRYNICKFFFVFFVLGFFFSSFAFPNE